MDRFAFGVQSSVLAGIGAIVLAVGCSSSTSGGSDAGSDGGGISTSSSSGGQASSSSSSGSSGGGASSSSGGQSADAGAAGYCNMASNSECLDYNFGVTASDAQIGCGILHGTYSATGSCDAASSVGGCRQTFGNGKIETTWFYSPITPDRVQPTCDADGNAVYVAP